jgi:hypothetical protein
VTAVISTVNGRLSSRAKSFLDGSDATLAVGLSDECVKSSYETFARVLALSSSK